MTSDKKREDTRTQQASIPRTRVPGINYCFQYVLIYSSCHVQRPGKNEELRKAQQGSQRKEKQATGQITRPATPTRPTVNRSAVVLYEAGTRTRGKVSTAAVLYLRAQAS